MPVIFIIISCRQRRINRPCYVIVYYKRIAVPFHAVVGVVTNNLATDR